MNARLLSGEYALPRDAGLSADGLVSDPISWRIDPIRSTVSKQYPIVC